MDYTIDPALLEDALGELRPHLERLAGGVPFRSFDHPAMDDHENYKYGVHAEARTALQLPFWKEETIGTGNIIKRVHNGLRRNVTWKHKTYSNNLLNWRETDEFAQRGAEPAMERTLFNFFKGRTGDETSFERLREIGLSYQFTAYLFFLKGDRNKYMPISQEGFNMAFEKLGVVGFLTTGKGSGTWENYLIYLDLIKQAQTLLRHRMGVAVNLLDAHSFLWAVRGEPDVWVSLPDEQEEVDADNHGTAQIEFKEEGDQKAFPEGIEVFNLHKSYERSSELVTAAKAKYAKEYPELPCAICGFSFAACYGKYGIGYIEAHHTIPVSEMQPGSTTRIEDLVMVCANCHKMLHRRRPWLRHDELKFLLH